MLSQTGGGGGGWRDRSDKGEKKGRGMGGEGGFSFLKAYEKVEFHLTRDF